MKSTFKGSKSEILILFDDSVINHLSEHRQIRRDYEVGGQLFAKFSESGCLRIEKVTGPRDIDVKKRFFYKPDKKNEQAEILSLFLEGYHYVGDWHTHPEKQPHPSSTDVNNIQNIFIKSKHTLTHMLLVIVGQLNLPQGLFVGLHNGKNLEPCFLCPTAFIEPSVISLKCSAEL